MELRIEHDSPVPLNKQAEELMRRLVELPEYQHGKLLPKETDLARTLGINRHTLRLALSRLVFEGLIIRTKGVGSKVALKSVVTRLENWHSFTQEMNRQGLEFINYSIRTDWVKPISCVSDFFNIREDKPVLKLSRLRGDQETPFVAFESYFHPRIGLTGHEDFTRPLYDILELDFSVIPAISRENIKAWPATTETAKQLQIRKGEPVLLRERFVSDCEGKPVEYNLGFYRSDKFVYSIEIAMSNK